MERHKPFSGLRRFFSSSAHGLMWLAQNTSSPLTLGSIHLPLPFENPILRTRRGLSLLWCAGDSRMEPDKTKCTPRAGSRSTSPLRFSLKNRSVILTSIRFFAVHSCQSPRRRDSPQNCARSKLHKDYVRYFTKNNPPWTSGNPFVYRVPPRFFRALRDLCGRTFSRNFAPVRRQSLPAAFPSRRDFPSWIGNAFRCCIAN